MKMIKFFILMIFILFAIQAPAEIYKYVDEQGSVHYTDDVNQVPEDQRDSFEVDLAHEADTFSDEGYNKTDSKEVVESEDLNVDVEDKEDVALLENQQEDGNSLNQSDINQQDLDEGRKRLEALKKDIDKEYHELVKEKEKLTQEKKTLVNREDIVRYNTKVENLNKRSEAYVQKGQQYKEQVEAYNVRVTQQNAEANQKKN